jgi:glycerophosphoryl diester phosphodiesterase
LETALSLLLDPDASVLIGHRGTAARAPENTMASFERALAEGAQAIELDVHLSADGVPVVVHDPSVDRTTDGRGHVGALSLDEILRLDAGARFTADDGATFPWRGHGVRIPTLDEVLAAFPTLPLIIEIKTAVASPAVRALLERHDALRRTVVASFDARALDVFAGTAAALGATQREVAGLLLAAAGGGGLRTAPAFHVASVPRRWRGIPLPVERFARLLRPWGRTVHVWTVDVPAVAAALWAGGVQGVITNDVEGIRRGS